MNEPIYKIKNLTKVYKTGNVHANIDISLDVHKGEIFGVFGPNGAGKTTLVRQMAGLIKPTSGSIMLDDVDVLRNPNQIPHYVAYYAQAPWIMWSLKVWEAIYFTGIFRGLSKKEARSQTEQLLVELGINDIRNRLMETLSGGQSKIMGIAVTLIGERPILILDEPTNELDPLNRQKMWRLFSQLCQQKGVTIILVTHNVLEAEEVVDRVIIIDKGKIMAQGTPGELKAKVDDRVRVQIKFKKNISFDGDAFINTFPDHQKLKADKWQVFVPRNEVASVYDFIINKIKLENIDDLRLITTTLEDVYIRMGGNADEFQT